MRESVDDPWSVPVNPGPGREHGCERDAPSFSWDAQTLYFGRAPGPEGSTDIYVPREGRGERRLIEIYERRGERNRSDRLS